jgi:DNA phosphorothioation-dependent restriction protein DptG
MTQDIIGIANKASKEWLKELPTPEETANQVPKRFLEIFAKLVAEEEREACAKVLEAISNAPDMQAYAKAIRARGQA